MTTKVINLNRVIDDKVTWDERVDLLDITAQALHRTSKRGQIDHGGDTGEVLQDDPTWLERHLLFAHIFGIVVRQGLDMLLCDREAV